jgi:hypothetical protein
MKTIGKVDKVTPYMPMQSVLTPNPAMTPGSKKLFAFGESTSSDLRQMFSQKASEPLIGFGS